MDAFEKLEKRVREMGLYACEAQHDISRSYKEDGSVLTATDLFVNSSLIETIRELFPTANLVTEELATEFNPDAPWSFVVDPIDGTDVYSQGLPSWAISLGILDCNLQCVGGMVYAPRWGLSHENGLFFRKDPDSQVTLNGMPFEPVKGSSDPMQVSMSSDTARYLDFSSYEGKLRCFGSNIIHMISILVHPNIHGSVSVPCYAWDMAGAHALLQSLGFSVEYYDGSPFVYTLDMLARRRPFKTVVLSGTKQSLREIRRMLPEKR